MGAGHDDTRPAEGHARGMATDTRRLGIWYVGGPTALLRVGGLHLLTDPTFDPPGEHPVGDRILVKTAGPAVPPEGLGAVDVVLLSHDQHPDNLDTLGRAYLTRVPLVLSTASAQDRLGGSVRALPAWTRVELPRPDGRVLQVTGVVLGGQDLPTVYVSGDNASLDVVRAIADRAGPVDVAVLFAAAARTALASGAYLTLTSQAAAEAARLLGVRAVVPLHFEGWAHLTQGRRSLSAAFEDAGLTDRLHLPEPGDRIELGPARS